MEHFLSICLLPFVFGAPTHVLRPAFLDNLHKVGTFLECRGQGSYTLLDTSHIFEMQCNMARCRNDAGCLQLAAAVAGASRPLL